MLITEVIVIGGHDSAPSRFIGSIRNAVILEMSLALQTVCERLELKLTDDPYTRLIASKIIELAQRGVRDASTLSAMTLKELNAKG